MGFLDVISGKQSVGSWLTGRSPDEEFIYNNEEGVANAVEYFNNVVSTDIPNAQQQIYAAVEELNSLPGIDGCFPSSMFDEAFVAVSDMVGQIGTTMQQKGDDIIAYGKAGFGTKFAATLGMVLAKPAEGFLSAFEDIGDGVLSVTGFIAGKFGNTDLQNSIGDFVKKDLSHDVFQYDKWAKYSAITEDSAISGGLKLVGKTAGYLYAGGMFSGAASSLGLGGTRIGTTALKLASSSTWGATAAAGIGGIGTGTSAGLKAGMEYDDAFGNGLKTGATQAAFAFAGGKLGEKLSKMGEVRQAKKALEGADETLNSASKEMNNAFENIIKNNTDDVVKQNIDDFAKNNLDDISNKYMDNFMKSNPDKFKSITNSFDDALKNGGDDALNVLKNNSDDFVKNVVSNNSDEALDAALKSRQAYNSAAQEAKNAASNLSNASSKSLSQYQGYSDAMTKAGERTGRAIGDTMKSGATALKDTASASYSIRHGNVDSGMKTQQAAQSQAAFRDNAMNLLKNDNPIAQGLAGLRNAGASLTAGGASQILPNTINSAANLAKQVPAALGAAAPILPSVAVNEMVHQSGQNPTPNIGSPVPTDGSGIDTQGIIDNADPTPIGGTQNPSPDPTPTPGNSGGSGGGGGGGNSGGGGGGGGQKPTPPTTTPQTTAKPTVAKPTTTPQTTTPPTKNNNDNRNNTDNNDDNKNNNDNNNRNSNNNDNRQRYDSGEQKNNNGSNNSTHSGYEYGSDGVAGGKPADAAASLADLVDDTDKSIDDIIKGSKYSRIPTSSKPIAAQGGSSSVIPIAAGLTAASAAGLGAKAYMDYKRSKEEDEDEEDEDEDYVNAIEKEDDLVVDGWTEDDESSYEPTGEDEFINIDKQGDEEYYSESENPVPIMGTEELEEF